MSNQRQANATRKALQDFLRQKKLYDDSSPDKRTCRYDEDFAQLHQSWLQQKEHPDFVAEEGAKPHNNIKNRYRDIIPYDYSRVKLELINGILGTDYINANYIRGAQDHWSYIASQGPLPHTVKDFWRMLWEQKTIVILMACNEFEGDDIPRHKCERYWAANSGEVMKFDNITVTLEKMIDSGCQDYIIRYLRAERDNEVHMCYQLQYTRWPDHGVPESVVPIIDMIAKARSYQMDESVPLVVHCSAGCGRTGTIIAVDIVWNLLKLGKLQNFNLFQTIQTIRQQRPALVQSLDQYKFVFDVVAEIFERQLDIMKKHDYENVVIQKKKPDITPRKTPLCKTSSGPKPVLPTKPPQLSGSNSQPKNTTSGAHNDKLSPESSIESGSPNVQTVKAIFENKTKENVPEKPPVKAAVFDKSQKQVTLETLNIQKPIAMVRTNKGESSNQPTDDTYSLAQKEDGSSDEEGSYRDQMEDEVEEGQEDDEKVTKQAEAYAYADPFMTDKWSLQHIALGKSIGGDDAEYSEVTTPPSTSQNECAPLSRKKIAGPAYEEIDDPSKPLPFANLAKAKKKAAPAYEEVNLDVEYDVVGSEMTANEDEGPVVPKRIVDESHELSNESITSKSSNQSLSALAGIFSTKISGTPPSDGKKKADSYKGRKIGFPFRLKKPSGPRGASNV